MHMGILYFSVGSLHFVLGKEHNSNCLHAVYEKNWAPKFWRPSSVELFAPPEEQPW